MECSHLARRVWKSAARYSKLELHELIDRVQSNDGDAIEEAVAFCVAESRGLWHGRARARICRNLKSREILEESVDRLVEAICRRLFKGVFAEQFKDQLTMAIRFRPDQVEACAERSRASEKAYVRRYAQWVLDKIARIRLQSDGKHS